MCPNLNSQLYFPTYTYAIIGTECVESETCCEKNHKKSGKQVSYLMGKLAACSAEGQKFKPRYGCHIILKKAKN